MNMKLEAPWYSFQKKVKALFEGDSDIQVEPVVDAPYDVNYDFILNIKVFNHEKFIAMQRVIAPVKEYGNVRLGIFVYDCENTNDTHEITEVYRTLLKDTVHLKDIKQPVDFTETEHGFIRFKPEVIQYHDDNIDDYYGNKTELAEDIAREVFIDRTLGIHFCTASLLEKDEVAE